MFPLGPNSNDVFLHETDDPLCTILWIIWSHQVLFCIEVINIRNSCLTKRKLTVVDMNVSKMCKLFS